MRRHENRFMSVISLGGVSVSHQQILLFTTGAHACSPFDRGLHSTRFPVNILHKSIAGRYRPVRVADGPITARCRFLKNANWVGSK